MRNSWMPEVFNDFFDTDFMPRTNATAPAINVKETEKDYTVELAAPGMKKEDFNINIDNRRTRRRTRTRKSTICAASSLTRNTSRLLFFLTMSIRKRLLPT